MFDRTRWYGLTDNLSKVLGPHNLKFGVNLSTDHYLQAHSSSGTPEGSFKFPQYFDTTAVQRPSIGAYDTTTGQLIYSNGISPMDPIVSPGYSDFQTALFKNFKLKERFDVQLRLETYNTFNSPEFDAVNTSAKFSPFTGGQKVQTINGPLMINGVSNQINSQFGQINGSHGPRVIQLAGRINF